MSEKMTRIRLGKDSAFRGFQDWGEKPPSEIISTVRRRAAYLRAEAEAIETAADEDFQIDIVRGPIAQHHVREVQKGKS